jgi:hypothetical protein
LTILGQVSQSVKLHRPKTQKDFNSVPASALLLPAANTFSGMRLSHLLAPASSSTSNVLLPPIKRKQSQIGGARDENEPVPVETDQKHAKQPRAAEGSPETSLQPILTVLQSGTSLGTVEAPLPSLPDTSLAPLVRPFLEMPGNSTTHHIDILVIAPTTYLASCQFIRSSNRISERLF